MFRTSLLLIATLIGFQASAGTQVWDLGQSGTNYYGKNYPDLNFAEDGIQMGITAWSGTTSQNLSEAWIGQWGSGLGVIYNVADDYSNGQHSMDNSGQYDALLLSFDHEVSLDSISIGWWSNDSDVSVAAYTGNGSVNGLSHTNWGNFLTNGWTSQGSYSDLVNNQYRSISATVTSKFWLVGAYNPSIENKGWTMGNDMVKVNGLKTSYTTTTEIPEPAAIGLFLLGLATLAGRKKNV